MEQELTKNFQTTQQNPADAAVDLMRRIRAEDNHVKQTDLIIALREIVVGNTDAAQRVRDDLVTALRMPIYNSNRVLIAEVIAAISVPTAAAAQQAVQSSPAQPRPAAA